MTDTVQCFCCGSHVPPGVPCPVDGNVTDALVSEPAAAPVPRAAEPEPAAWVTSAAELESEPEPVMVPHAQKARRKGDKK